MPKFLIKLNRLLAYILMPLVIAILITGYRNKEHFNQSWSDYAGRDRPDKRFD